MTIGKIFLSLISPLQSSSIFFNLVFLYKPITDTANRLKYPGMRRVIFDIPPEPDDEVVDRTRVRFIAQAPYLLKYFFPGYGLSGIDDQVTKQFCFH